ncbi:SPOR domain-containing protein [Yoonia sp. BS5-3]|uniref:SPOR domain-containing protein n=1 Tax=Yoonia phaeophyticola TaxID=3137369 RepID=A0ABZ2V2G7_9RHOB
MMTGIMTFVNGSMPRTLALLGCLGLAACDENGEFAFPAGDGATAAEPSTRRTITTPAGNDVERPDIFDITDRGLWDGRPSLGGAWVAHPDVTEPERVIIRNPANGRSVVGALFRRERENPGPLLQVSSDAAEELGLLAGAPTELSVIALRREEVEVEEEAGPEDNPVVASLAAPVSVESAPLDPVADGAAAAIDAADATAEAAVGAAAVAAVALPADETGEAPPEAAPVDVSAIIADVPVTEPGSSEVDLDAPYFQIGVFSVEANANAAAERLRGAGLPAAVIVEQAGGNDVWRVVAAQSDVDADLNAALTRIQGLGFVDAVTIGETAEEEEG